MQADALQLSVDATNTGAPSTETYTRYEEFQNRASYIGVGHTPDDRDLMAIYRTFPTKAGNFKGTGKSAVKLTRDVQVAGVDSSTTITSPIILDCSFSVPVGTPVAELKHARQRMIAILDDDIFMDSLNVQLMV